MFLGHSILHAPPSLSGQNVTLPGVNKKGNLGGRVIKVKKFPSSQFDYL